MVNLLFISNSTKMDAIKNTLQPLLKVKIDIVADFDFGLKDVFEKRPATVFIQDQIAGVTGESVARHIQMLLGSGAPSFIFMHEGSLKAKPINGLFEYLIDLSQVEVKIVADIQATLKSLLGSQWEKISISPKIDRAAIRSAVAVPEGSRAIADQIVEEFISDLGDSGSTSAGIRDHATDFSESTAPSDEPFQVESSYYDQLLEMHSETSGDIRNSEVTNVLANLACSNNPSALAHMTVTTELDQQPILPNHSESVITPSAQFIFQPQPIQKDITSVVSTLSSNHDDVAVSTSSRSVSENPLPQQVSPANFLIRSEERPTEDITPEELLHIFEENYFSHSVRWKRYVIIIVLLLMCIGGSFWYLLKQKPQFLKHVSIPTVQSVIVAPATRPAGPVISIQKPVSTPAQKAVMPAMPSFIPKTGLDSSFVAQNPGWERYIDTELEFRVYRAAGKIKALQVLGVKNHVISDSKLKSILIELLGDGEYIIKSRERKFGYHVSRAIIGNKSELLIYRKKSTIRAFVVSLD